MRRWAWRGALAIAALLVMLSSAVGVKAFDRACDGSLEGLRYLTNVRIRIVAATAPPPPTPAAPTPVQAQVPSATPLPTPPTPVPPTLPQQALAAVGMAGDTAIGALLLVKQHDAVAYPAHIVAAHLLDAAGCGEDAVRLQWLKAGLHASRAGQPEYVAATLQASTRDPDDLAELRQLVRTWTERAPESVSLRSLLAALDG